MFCVDNRKSRVSRARVEKVTDVFGHTSVKIIPAFLDLEYGS